MSIMQFIENCQDICDAGKYARPASEHEQKNQSSLGFQVHGAQNLANMAAELAGVAKTGKKLTEAEDEKRRRAGRSGNKGNTAELIAMLEPFADFNALGDGIAAEYGQGFALDLLADLNADGLVSDEDFQRISAIEDIKEQRLEAAKLILEGLRNGTISYEDFEGHPWAEEWLGTYEEDALRNQQEAQAGIEGTLSTDQMKVDSKDIAKEQLLENSPDMLRAFKDSSVQEQFDMREKVVDAENQLFAFNPNDLSGLS